MAAVKDYHQTHKRQKREIIFHQTQDYNDSKGNHWIEAIMKLATTAGVSVDDPEYFSGCFGEIEAGSAVTTTKNYFGGLIGSYNMLGTDNSTYPTGAVLGQIHNGVADCKGAFVAFIDGDSLQTNAEAAFKVMNQSTINFDSGTGGFNYGLDLQDAAHDSFAAVDQDFYLKAAIRIPDDIAIMAGDIDPVNGTSGTGAGFAGPGSLYINSGLTSGTLGAYINDNTKASPTWKKITNA